MEIKQKNVAGAGHFILLRGGFFILFGLLAFFWAGPTLWALILVFGFFALLDGIILIAMYAKHRSIWGSASIWFGILSILIGLCTLFFPSLTAIVLAFFIAIRAFLGGILEIKMAMHLKKHVAGEILFISNGILSMLFALVLFVLLFSYPILGLLVLVEVIGLYAVCLGVLLVVLSSRLKKRGKEAQNEVSTVF